MIVALRVAKHEAKDSFRIRGATLASTAALVIRMRNVVL